MQGQLFPVGHQFHFLRHRAGVYFQHLLDWCCGICCDCGRVADTLCVDSVQNAGSISLVCSVYGQYLYRRMAGVLLYFAGSISAEQKEKTCGAFLLRLDRSVSGDWCIMAGTHDGRLPDDGAGCGTGTMHSAPE